MSKMLSYHFERTAQEKGYGESEVWYSLGFCQGDHVSLDGKPDLEALISRLLPDHLQEAARGAVDKGLSITIREGRIDYECAADTLDPLEEEAEQALIETVTDYAAKENCFLLRLDRDADMHSDLKVFDTP